MFNPPQLLTPGATHDIEITGFYDRVSNTYPVNATLVMTLYDQAGNPVTGATNITLAYVSGTVGAAAIYRGKLPKTVALTRHTTYRAVAIGTDAAGESGVFVTECPVL